MAIEYYLKHKKFDIEVAYNFIYQIFEAEKWILLPEEILKKIIQVEKNEDSEYLYFLLQTREKALQNLKNWVNINNIDDIEGLRALIYNDLKKNFDSHTTIFYLSSIHSHYVPTKFENDILDVKNNIFYIDDIYLANRLIRSISDALIHIKNTKTHKRELVFIRNTEKDIVKVLYEGNSLYDNNHGKYFSCKIMNYIKEQKIDQNKYFIINPLLCGHDEKYINNKIDIAYTDDSIELKLNINNEYFLISVVDINKFAKTLYQMLLFLESDKKAETFILDHKNNIKFKISRDSLSIEGCSTRIPNAIDLIFLFQDIFFHYSIYLKINYNKSLFDILNIERKYFLKIIGLLNR